MKKYSKHDQKLLAKWALACAKRVLPYFEKINPKDERPRIALETCQKWISSGIFSMAEIRGASLGAHAAAREVKDNEAACFSARAAGQAVATAHVTQHAYGGAYYALKVIMAINPVNTEAKLIKEYKWQEKHLPNNLRKEIMSRIIITKNKNKISIKINKGEGF